MSKNNTQLAPTNDNRSLANAQPVKSAGGMMSVFSDAQQFESALGMANCLSQSTVVPKEYQGNPGNCLIAIEMSARIHTSPMMVMQNLFVVNGRPAWSSQWIIAMINSSKRYKTELQFEFGHDQADGGLSCMAWAEDWQGHKVLGPKITMNLANAEGWTNKTGSKWKTMPEVMIRYRAASFFGRMNCPDMIMGIYSQEEAADMGEGIPDADFALVADPETGEVHEVDTSKMEKITQEQRQELFKFAKEKFGARSNDIIKTAIAEEGLETTEGMPVYIFDKVMEKLVALANAEAGNEGADDTEN